MTGPNDRLRAAREARESQAMAGEPMSRSELAEAVNAHVWQASGHKTKTTLDANTIARYERGDVRWPSSMYRTALRAVLGAETDAELGFAPTPRGRTSSVAGTSRTMSPAGYSTTVDLGASPTDFLGAITAETPVPSSIGWPEVHNVRSTTRAVAMLENLYGGGLSCEAAIGQLRWCGKLLDAPANNDVRRAMYEAVGNLSGVVAFSAFDIMNYRAADQCFHFALWCADHAGSWALRANTLAEMSRKAVYLGDIDEALSLIEFAQVRADRVSETAQAMMATVRARLLALLDRDDEARAEVDRADQRFADRDPSDDPPWLCYYDEAEHQGSTGRALIPIASKSKKPELAAPRLNAAIRLHDEKYPRSRTFSRTRLAALIMTAGDPHEALPIGRQALADAVPLRSQRIVGELRGLAKIAERHTRIGDVAELQHDIAALASSGA